MKKVLILSATASAINYINSLASSNEYVLFVTDASPFASGLYDERITPILIPRARNQNEYRMALEKIIAEHHIDIMIPTSDHDMEGVAALLRDGWSPNVIMFNFSWEHFFLYTNKLLLANKLKELGFDTVNVYYETDEIKFPVVIKPTREGGSKGVWIVKDKTEFFEKLSLVKSHYGSDLIIQEYIPGETGSIFVILLLYGQDGKSHGEVVTQSTLTYMRWGGGGNAGRIVENQELIDYAKQIVEKLGGWAGPINLEVKRHSGNGKYYLMEINCRLNGYSYLNSMNNLNFPKGVMDLLIKGSTAFITSKGLENKKNFIISNYEKVVKNWVQ